MAYWRLVVVAVFLAGLVLAGLVGTSASPTFIWPAYGLIGLASALSIGLLFRRATFRLPRWAVLAVAVAGGYLMARASDSPVAYFAREDAALVIVCFLAYGLFLHLFDSARARRGLVDGLAVLVLLNLVFAFFQATVRPSLWLLPGYERTFTDRPGGLFNHPDHFAGFLAMLAPLWLAMAVFSRRSRAMRWASAGLAVASAATALAVGGVVAGLALLAGGAIFVALACWTIRDRLSLDTRKTLFAIVAGIVAILAVGAMAANRPLARYLDRGVLTKSGDL
ncbi:MAG TPA: hypothetical protein PLA50_16395, partial [Bacteroidia bacterium]|nr:hypothetical protein [Bacteroidia bacterium]